MFAKQSYCSGLLILILIRSCQAQFKFANESIDEINSTWINITNELSQASGNFPADLMPGTIRNNGGIILHIFILAYLCLNMGIICDVYFLPSLEIISQVLKIPPEIAGATFMAMGTSAPDLFTSIMGVFVSEDDIGIGTILGAAVFNLIAVPAVCGITVVVSRQKAPKINRFPILCDSVLYIIAILTLIVVIKDNQVDWIESTIMLGLFTIYLVLMYFNAKYSDEIQKIFTSGEEICSPLKEKSRQQWKTLRMITKTSLSQYRRARVRSTKRIVIEIVDESREETVNWFEKNRFFKYLLFPMTLLFRITLPKPNRCSFVFTFILSIVWLGALTYVSVWMVTIIGFTFGLPDAVSGLTILAASASMPDLIASVLVVKKASKANMIICSSIGANIFGILFCLGLPWLLKIIIVCIKKGTMNLKATAVHIDSTTLPLTTCWLLICIFSLIITLHFTHWKLDYKVGIVFSIIYLIFVLTSSTLEIHSAKI